MVRQLFALGSVTALTGLVVTVAAVGCSSKENKVDTDTTIPYDAGKRSDGAAQSKPDATATATCMTTTPIDATKFPYNKAGFTLGACTDAELTALDDFVGKKSVNDPIVISEWKGAVSDKCAQCVFTDIGNASWGPIISKDDKLDGVNRGGCIAVVSGKESCGKSYQQTTDCTIQACLDNCKTQEEFDTCRADLQGVLTGPCKATYDAMVKECGADLGSFEKSCSGTKFTFEGPVKVMCISGKPVGGASDGG